MVTGAAPLIRVMGTVAGLAACVVLLAWCFPSFRESYTLPLLLPVIFVAGVLIAVLPGRTSRRAPIAAAASVSLVSVGFLVAALAALALSLLGVMAA